MRDYQNYTCYKVNLARKGLGTGVAEKAMSEEQKNEKLEALRRCIYILRTCGYSMKTSSKFFNSSYPQTIELLEILDKHQIHVSSQYLTRHSTADFSHVACAHRFYAILPEFIKRGADPIKILNRILASYDTSLSSVPETIQRELAAKKSVLFYILTEVEFSPASFDQLQLQFEAYSSKLDDKMKELFETFINNKPSQNEEVDEIQKWKAQLFERSII